MNKILISAFMLSALASCASEPAIARPNEEWQLRRVQAEIDGDQDTIRWLEYVGKAGTLPCKGNLPEGTTQYNCQQTGTYFTSCCGEADAYEADETFVDKEGRVYAVLTCNDPRNCREVAGRPSRPPGSKFLITPNKVLVNHDPVNYTGHGVIWIRPYVDVNGDPYVYCYAPPAGL